MELHIPEPNPKQVKFLEARKKYVGFGGARGGGKSWSVRTKAKLLGFKYPGIRMLIVRRTYPELMNNHINILKRELLGFATYNSTDKIIKFANGSTINLAYCQYDKDLDRLQGQEYDVIFLDEATQLTEYQMKAITACMRGVNKFPKRTYYTCNPGGQGHAYIKRVFIDRKFNPGEDPDEYEFIQSLVTDNKALMASQPDYVKQLESLPPKLREAWLKGRWDIFEGQVFEEFTNNEEHYKDRKMTHVINPFIVPADWTILRGFDWGYSKPFSVGWYALDHENRIYRIRELYGCTRTPNEGVKWTTQQVASAIYEIEHNDPNLKGKTIRGIADPAIFDVSTGRSIAEDLEAGQIFFEPADHNRIPGKMQCHFRLHFDKNGIPMFYVFKSCPEFIRCIPALIYSETKTEDVDTNMEDHNYDEWRYVCMAYPLNPKQIIDDKKIVGTDGITDPLQVNRPIKYGRYDYITRL